MRLVPVAVLLTFLSAIWGQPVASDTTTTTSVPRIVRIASSFRPADGSTPASFEGVTLSIYKEAEGGTPLWQETQNVAVDGDGHYNVLLGATRNDGVPVDLFSSGEPRWLGVKFQRPGESEQARVLLASVPYALKAADAEMLGGKPASAYLLSPTAVTTAPAAGSAVTASSAVAGDSSKTGKLNPKITSGTAGFLGMFTNTTDLGNSMMFQNGMRVGAGTTNPLDYFHVAFNDSTGVFTGYAVQNLGNGASSYSGMLFYDQNGALGQFQGFNNSTHEYRINNIASNGSINFMLASNSKFLVRSDGDVDIPGSIRKSGSLFLHNLGSMNTALGINAIPSSSTGDSNTAAGFDALQLNSSGSNNTGFGIYALEVNTTGNDNTAVGFGAIDSIIGDQNTVIGSHALTGELTGSNNIAIGYLASSAVRSGSNNIHIGNSGITADGASIRIGTTGTQTSFFAAGIRGVTTGNANAIPVVIDTNGQLGTVSSSRRFKEDIQDMGDASDKLMDLRPVTYRYKQAYADGSKPIDYGLIAEEVEEVYPGLVARSADGQIETVQYQKLTPMLLNELQKQQETIRQLQEKLAALQKTVEALTARQ